ncbi:Bug family tripartite tricarboxylate transporter substrate binding protein [Pseudorhodoferax sp.]|uniref:Bug family tripartite tricarboxylate transporter substrate binding protein n=1 Tax=Pseudorhodoferax sp. TaxID=1993553 RepID=UPI0039E69630
MPAFRFPRRRALLAALAALPLAAAAQGDGWPGRPLRMIVGYPAGSSPDMQARLLATPLAQALGQPVVVENRPGASGNIGADQIAKATDGHTIGVVGNGPLTSSPFLYARLPYDPARDFAPLALIGSAPLAWVAPAALVPGSGKAFVESLRAQGDKTAYGSTGPGSGGHLGMELIKQATGIAALHVPFAGGPPIINALLGGQLQTTLLPVSTVLPLLQAGKLKAVAVTTPERSALAPDIAALPEVGVEGVRIEVWNAVMAPAAMPAAHQARLSATLAKILQQPEVRDKLFAQGWKVQDPSPAALRQRMAADTALYRDIIAKQHIRLD